MPSYVPASPRHGVAHASPPLRPPSPRASPRHASPHASPRRGVPGPMSALVEMLPPPVPVPETLLSLPPASPHRLSPHDAALPLHGAHPA